MDIRGGGDGGTSHTKNPNQIFPIIYTLSSKYLYLSLARILLLSHFFHAQREEIILSASIFVLQISFD